MLQKQQKRMALTTLEIMILIGSIFKKTLSKIYGTLVNKNRCSELSRIRWQKELKKEITHSDWQLSHSYITAISYNIAIQENFCKIRQRWYLTPHRLNKMSTGLDPCCWQFKQERGNLLHIWCECEKIHNFWKEIYNEIRDKLNIAFNFSPESCLLHLNL